ncbi:MAG: glucose 1-dehydrogenase [Acidobacteriota bacterium]
MGVLDSFRLQGKVAIVTGGSRGLGYEMALALAESGAHLVLVGRDGAQLAAAEQKIRGVGGDCLALAGDVAMRGEAQRIADKAFSWKGRLDILVNNAGTIARGPALEVKEEDWDRVLDLNLHGAFFMAQAVGKIMVGQRSGKIINVGSMNTVVSARNVIPYTVSKGGVGQMTKALAVEWGQYNVQVNCILPGYYETDLTAALRNDPERYAYFQSRIPLGRWGKPADLKGAIAFLASGASDYITGVLLPIDGGYLAG